MNNLNISAVLFTFVMLGCSENGVVNSISPSAASELQNEKILPFFVFNEDGTRLVVENGMLVEEKMNRTVLVLEENESLADLKKKYEDKFLSDSDYYWGLKRPADYVCNDALLAINADYNIVKSATGDTLLSDVSLYEDCKSLDLYQGVLKKEVGMSSGFNSSVWVEAGGFALYVESVVEKGKSYDKGGNVVEPFWGVSKAVPYIVGSFKLGPVVFHRLPYRADAVHMYLACGRGCRDVGNDVNCKKVDSKGLSWHNPDGPSIDVDETIVSNTCNTVMEKTTTCYNPCLYIQQVQMKDPSSGQTYFLPQCVGGMEKCTIPDYGMIDDFGVVSNVSVVIDGGNVVLMATTAAEMSENVASKFYKKYIYDVYSNP
ncbi:hypothetical protein [Fibrobacter sp.]|uniref:hypothetical protein n=1 Tax=Fibrobacter sp. TaxID=35828 RepID=UPI00386438C6